MFKLFLIVNLVCLMLLIGTSLGGNTNILLFLIVVISNYMITFALIKKINKWLKYGLCFVLFVPIPFFIYYFGFGGLSAAIGYATPMQSLVISTFTYFFAISQIGISIINFTYGFKIKNNVSK